jgi:hypothetical protein
LVPAVTLFQLFIYAFGCFSVMVFFSCSIERSRREFGSEGDGSGFVADSEGDSAEYLALGRVRSVVAGCNSAAVHSMIRKFSGVKPFVLATRRHGCQQYREQEQRCCHLSHAHAVSYHRALY